MAPGNKTIKNREELYLTGLGVHVSEFTNMNKDQNRGETYFKSPVTFKVTRPATMQLESVESLHKVNPNLLKNFITTVTLFFSFFYYSFLS